jgi:hypothetical protein
METNLRIDRPSKSMSNHIHLSRNKFHCGDLDTQRVRERILKLLFIWIRVFSKLLV